MAIVARGPQYKFAGATDVVNGTAGSFLGSVMKFYAVAVKNAGGTAVNLTAQDDADGEAFEVIIRSIPGLLAYDSVGADGVVYAIVDGHASPDAEVVQNAIRALGTSVGPAAIDVSGTTVVNGTRFTVA